MWRALILGMVFVFLTQPLALASLGQNYEIDTFQPYLDRHFNTLLGWKGQPVNLKDPHLYLYHPKTGVPVAMVEFLYQDHQIHTEILKVFNRYQDFNYAETQELKWFLIQAVKSQITPSQIETISKLRGGPCAKAEVFRVTTPDHDYYLTFYTNAQETFVRVSLLKPEGLVKDYQACFDS